MLVAIRNEQKCVVEITMVDEVSASGLFHCRIYSNDQVIGPDCLGFYRTEILTHSDFKHAHLYHIPKEWFTAISLERMMICPDDQMTQLRHFITNLFTCISSNGLSLSSGDYIGQLFCAFGLTPFLNRVQELDLVRQLAKYVSEDNDFVSPDTTSLFYHNHFLKCIGYATNEFLYSETGINGCPESRMITLDTIVDAAKQIAAK